MGSSSEEVEQGVTAEGTLEEEVGILLTRWESVRNRGDNAYGGHCGRRDEKAGCFEDFLKS